MYEQELGHLRKFEHLIPKHRARPSALLPVWYVAGYALGNTMYYIDGNASKPHISIFDENEVFAEICF